jgi:hypothetical protein
MKYAEYVISGWVITAGALGAYWWRLRVRVQRARRSLELDALSTPGPDTPRG